MILLSYIIYKQDIKPLLGDIIWHILTNNATFQVKILTKNDDMNNNLIFIYFYLIKPFIIATSPIHTLTIKW